MRCSRDAVAEIELDGRRVESRTRSGWVTLAAVLIVIVGVYNFVWGYGALDKKELFNESSLVYSNLNFWGWVFIVIGALQILTAIVRPSGRRRNPRGSGGIGKCRRRVLGAAREHRLGAGDHCPEHPDPVERVCAHRRLRVAAFGQATSFSKNRRWATPRAQALTVYRPRDLASPWSESVPSVFAALLATPMTAHHARSEPHQRPEKRGDDSE